MKRVKGECHLVVTRKLGERIKVDGPASFEVLEIRGNRVKVGVSAPKSTRILRGELIEREPEETAA